MMLLCPVCGKELHKTERTWRCDANHCFDEARQGYVNLLTVDRKHAKHPGDTKASGTTPSSGCWSLVFTARLWLETCRSQNSSTVSGVLEVPQPSYLSGTSAMMLGFVSTRGQWMTSC